MKKYMIVESKLALLYCVIWAISITAISGSANITAVPTNRWTLVNRDVTFVCTVSGQQELEDSFYWYKLPSGEELVPSIIAKNALTRDNNKYVITDKYDLTIANVSITDEGVYECTLAGYAYNAQLNVTVPPSRIQMYTPTNLTGFLPGDTLTLLCDIVNSRPVPTIRWYKGQLDLTRFATTNCTQPDEEGFADCISKIDMVLNKYDFLTSILCVADQPNYPEIMMSEFQVELGASSIVPFCGPVMFLLAYFTIYSGI